MFTWIKNLFNKPDVSRPRSVDLINLHDYPRSKYSAYWEIFVNGSDKQGYFYRVRIMDVNSNKVLAEEVGEYQKRDQADTAAQTFVLNIIENYRRIA